MMTKILRVVSQTESITITKSDNSVTQKSTLLLQELGGQYQPTYAAALVGNQQRFYPGELVVVSLRFTTHEYQQQVYQDVLATEIQKLG